MKVQELGLLAFKEFHLERIWGGQEFHAIYGKDIPPDRPIGETWLVSDHPSAESVVADGTHAGRTLRQLLQEDAGLLLGRRATLTVQGRFPLLLKLLDAREVLSVQVHPDDETARRLGERDSGKTEMWHVLHAEPGSEIICGIDPRATAQDVRRAVEKGLLDKLLVRFGVRPGDSIFVPAGVVHTVGAGVLLAEIQQTSDVTYRLYDWGRTELDGSPRELHVDKALAAVRLGVCHGGLSKPLSYVDGATRRTLLAACRHFAAELLELTGETFRRLTHGDSFHILLGKSGTLAVETAGRRRPLKPGQAVLAPGGVEDFVIEGAGAILDYFVPDLLRDVVDPLLAHGHSLEDIVRLGGHPTHSDICIEPGTAE